jgi:hypothetical protein
MGMKNANSARKTMVLALSISAIAITLTGCGATGVDSPTRNIRQVTDGVEGQSGSIKARNVLLVAQPDGSASLVAFFVNESDQSDAIASIVVNGTETKINPAQNELIKDRPVIFGGDSATAKANVPGISATPGKRVDLTINLVAGAPMTLNALIVEKSDIYANLQ